uniref:Uncharacterized protein n=1 Tax=Setaria viridis TaxID=4556 RepID=A0A4U6SRV7_SETVI|nr:hypothetical protein SEVIR_9G102350v2 [Setaria viridis]
MFSCCLLVRVFYMCTTMVAYDRSSVLKQVTLYYKGIINMFLWE